ncbi:unnamed protein product [Mesocestoides corti]|uniref:Nuclear protein MDM1 n=1 Tax=Mesocestoides corti TaxID=53468 RepID=A0A0R3UE14_MESCO|nr:unnamed protein product [Mesocestoides corti]
MKHSAVFHGLVKKPPPGATSQQLNQGEMGLGENELEQTQAKEVNVPPTGKGLARNKKEPEDDEEFLESIRRNVVLRLLDQLKPNEAGEMATTTGDLKEGRHAKWRALWSRLANVGNQLREEGNKQIRWLLGRGRQMFQALNTFGVSKAKRFSNNEETIRGNETGELLGVRDDAVIKDSGGILDGQDGNGSSKKSWGSDSGPHIRVPFPETERKIRSILTEPKVTNRIIDVSLQNREDFRGSEFRLSDQLINASTIDKIEWVPGSETLIDKTLPQKTKDFVIQPENDSNEMSFKQISGNQLGHKLLTSPSKQSVIASDTSNHASSKKFNTETHDMKLPPVHLPAEVIADKGPGSLDFISSTEKLVFPGKVNEDPPSSRANKRTFRPSASSQPAPTSHPKTTTFPSYLFASDTPYREPVSFSDETLKSHPDTKVVRNKYVTMPPLNRKLSTKISGNVLEAEVLNPRKNAERPSRPQITRISDRPTSNKHPYSSVGGHNSHLLELSDTKSTSSALRQLRSTHSLPQATLSHSNAPLILSLNEISPPHTMNKLPAKPSAPAHSTAERVLVDRKFVQVPQASGLKSLSTGDGSQTNSHRKTATLTRKSSGSRSVLEGGARPGSFKSRP